MKKMGLLTLVYFSTFSEIGRSQSEDNTPTYEISEDEIGDEEFKFEDKSISNLSDEEETQEDLEKSVIDELDLIPGETRDLFSKGVLISLGATRPWQYYSLSLTTVQNSNTFWVWSVGSGNFEFKADIEELPFDIQAKSKTFDVALKWFITADMPIYLTTGVGAFFLNGNIDPQGTVLDVDKPSVEKLTSGFTINGLYLFTGVGVSVIKKNGFYLDYNFLGFGTSHLLSSTMTNESNQGKSELKGKTQRGQTWGFSNIAIGMFFK